MDEAELLRRVRAKVVNVDTQALKKLEDMTFSDEEIDAFLPKELKRTSKGGGNV